MALEATSLFSYCTPSRKAGMSTNMSFGFLQIHHKAIYILMFNKKDLCTFLRNYRLVKMYTEESNKLFNGYNPEINHLSSQISLRHLSFCSLGE
jgi:hypothetical protein